MAARTEAKGAYGSTFALRLKLEEGATKALFSVVGGRGRRRPDEGRSPGLGSIPSQTKAETEADGEACEETMAKKKLGQVGRVGGYGGWGNVHAVDGRPRPRARRGRMVCRPVKTASPLPTAPF